MFEAARGVKRREHRGGLPEPCGVDLRADPEGAEADRVRRVVVDELDGDREALECGEGAEVDSSRLGDDFRVCVLIDQKVYYEGEVAIPLYASQDVMAKDMSSGLVGNALMTSRTATSSLPV